MHPCAATDSIPRGATAISLLRISATKRDEVVDSLAIEEPLEIRLVHTSGGKQHQRTIAITMRTPGQDVELAIGFLFNEGILSHRDEVRAAAHVRPEHGCRAQNRVQVELHDHVAVKLESLERNFYTTSSCGVCGKTSIAALATGDVPPLRGDCPRVSQTLIHRLPELLREAQAVFDSTGGLHASGLFSSDGQLQCLREDVGRHNALDKLIGRQFLDGLLPAEDQVLVLSGRASFELLQKAARAGIAVVVAIGAPSSLAVRMARHHDITLIGFARGDRFNLYTAPERISAGHHC